MGYEKYITSVGEAEANERLCQLLGPGFRAYRRRWEQVCNCELLTEFPLFLLVESFYRCNLRCIHCIQGYQELRTQYAYPDRMSLELYKAIIDEAAQHHCPSIGLNHINEPLLVKDLPDRVRYAADHGFLDTMFNTNGLLLTEPTIDRLLDSGLTRLMVSLDAATKETYDKIRIGSDFHTVVNNVHRFLQRRRSRNLALPLLRITFVRMSMNEHEIEPFIEFWKDKADYISIQEFASPAPGWEKFEPFFAHSRTIVSTFSCPQPWQRLIVQGDGTVLPCCSQFGRELQLGNVKEQSIQSMWRSPAMERLRTIHKAGRYKDNPTCAKCVSTWVSKEDGVPQQLAKPQACS